MAYGFYGWQNAAIQDELGLTPRDYYDLLSQNAGAVLHNGVSTAGHLWR